MWRVARYKMRSALSSLWTRRVTWCTPLARRASASGTDDVQSSPGFPTKAALIISFVLVANGALAYLHARVGSWRFFGRRIEPSHKDRRFARQVAVFLVCAGVLFPLVLWIVGNILFQ